jgi:hypothetical protein
MLLHEIHMTGEKGIRSMIIEETCPAFVGQLVQVFFHDVQILFIKGTIIQMISGIGLLILFTGKIRGVFHLEMGIQLFFVNPWKQGRNRIIQKEEIRDILSHVLGGIARRCVFLVFFGTEQAEAWDRHSIVFGDMIQEFTDEANRVFIEASCHGLGGFDGRLGGLGVFTHDR